MATQIPGDFGRLEVSWTIVQWERRRWYGGIIVACVKQALEKTEMILFPWHNFIEGDLDKGEEDVMVDIKSENVTISQYLINTKLHQEGILGEWERAPTTESVRRDARRTIKEILDTL